MERNYFIITFSHNICGCDVDEYVIARTMKDAEDWAAERLDDYAENYAEQYFGYGVDYTDEEYEQYLDDCDFIVTVGDGTEGEYEEI